MFRNWTINLVDMTANIIITAFVALTVLYVFLDLLIFKKQNRETTKLLTEAMAKSSVEGKIFKIEFHENSNSWNLKYPLVNEQWIKKLMASDIRISTVNYSVINQLSKAIVDIHGEIGLIYKNLLPPKDLKVDEIESIVAQNIYRHDSNFNIKKDWIEANFTAKEFADFYNEIISEAYEKDTI